VDMDGAGFKNDGRMMVLRFTSNADYLCEVQTFGICFEPIRFGDSCTRGVKGPVALLD